MRLRAVALLALVLSLAAPAAVTDARASVETSFVDAAGIRVEGVTQLDARQYEISVLSDALGRAVDVRVLVPEGYDPQGAPLPVLYLFHGTSGRASDWVEAGEAVQATAGLPLIVVMPDAGFDGNGGSWFTNWVDTTTALGPSQWETFHVDQLIPWVDANLRTVAAREGRAVAGLSQGGFGSTTYAARHPDLFVSVASFSGAPDIDYNPAVAAGATAIIEATAVGLNGTQPEAMFGSRVTNEINWQGHDPATLVENLRGVDVWLYTATGAPGPYDPGIPNPASAGIEAATHASTMSFAQRAQQLGVPVHLDNYLWGTHAWPYWARDLREYLVPLMGTFAEPPAPPAAASYRSVEPTWTQWGWTVSFDRLARQEFSVLEGATPAGFTLHGTGVADVTTPPVYAPAATATVRTSGSLGDTVAVAPVGCDGRLRLRVPLGSLPALPPVIGVPVIPAGSSATVAIETVPPSARRAAACRRG